MPGLEAEVAGQPAAARVQHVQVDPGGAQQRLVRVVAHDGVLVAVGLRDRLPAQRAAAASRRCDLAAARPA